MAQKSEISSAVGLPRESDSTGIKNPSILIDQSHRTLISPAGPRARIGWP